MQNHLDTIRLLNEQQVANQATLNDLCEKIEKLTVAVDTFSRARRVLMRKAKKLQAQGDGISKKLQWEINQLQNRQVEIAKMLTEGSSKVIKKKG